MKIAGRRNWLSELPGKIRQEILDRMEVKKYQAGHFICRAGDLSDGMHQVMEGYVKLLGIQPTGAQSLIAIYSKGDCFSETTLVCGRIHHHSALSATDTTLLFLKKEDFHEIYSMYPEVPEILCRKFANSLSAMIDYREYKSTYPIAIQVAFLFDNLSEFCSDSISSARRTIEVPITVSDIADFLGVTRQTVQKEITILRNQKIIDKALGYWIITNPRKLSLLCSAHQRRSEY